MTTVNIVRDDGVASVKITGHAGYDEKGKDIVCSAISILTYTLMQSLEVMDDYNKLRVLNLKCTEGDTEIMAEPYTRHQKEMDILIDTIETGYELLAQTYSEYIKVIHKGVSYNSQTDSI